MSVQIAANAPVETTGSTHQFENSRLTGENFLMLMIEELLHQDPLEPMKNEELLSQIANIKNMETLANLDETMTGMTFQQQVATAGALIGKEVSGVSNTGANVTGVVVKVTASGTNGVAVVTEAGHVIAMDKVTMIQEVGDDG